MLVDNGLHGLGESGTPASAATGTAFPTTLFRPETKWMRSHTTVIPAVPPAPGRRQRSSLSRPSTMTRDPFLRCRYVPTVLMLSPAAYPPDTQGQ